MGEVLPLTLVGNNLGERHRYLNILVSNVYQQSVPLQSVLELPENKPIDRVFKIQLALKYKDVDFIVENLKNKDMLYVSEALKSMWLLEPEYRHIINPVCLEKNLYPDMITTAVNKMKNFIELKLKDPDRCQEFYEYYSFNFDVAIKFLWHCPKEFIIREVSKVLEKLTPKHLRILCEACPRVAKVYFEGLENNKDALHRYVMDPHKYYKSIIKVLKVDGNLYLDLLEKYFDRSCMDRLNSSATRYIMINYKTRYLTKPELYAAWFLHVKTLARYLNRAELKDILLRLACAQYLGCPFTYQEAEPFIKCLSAEERTLIKKQIFVDKSIGSYIENWPYSAPKALQYDWESYSEPFGDNEHEPWEYERQEFYSMMGKRKLTKRCAKYMDQAMCCMSSMPRKSTLDQLFDRYRFENFHKTFFELRKLLLTEGTIDGRRSMMLVLVSKTGGDESKLEQLLKFLVERHINEPVHLRDAIARSMVKRAFVWRLRTETWELLLKWATTSVPEILHTTICRHLLTGSACSPEDLSAYLQDFCDLTEYSFNAAEKTCIAERLPSLLISADAPDKLLDTLKAYNLRVDTVSGAEDFLVSAARKDEDILRRLFESRIARKRLLKESFRITQMDAGYVNALKHDLAVLAIGESFAALVSKEKPSHDRFLRALVLYFSEPNGLAVRHRLALEKQIDEECREFHARPLAFLFNSGSASFIDHVNKTDFKSLKGSHRKFAASLRANAFVVRPVIDIDVINWYAVGAKFINNNVVLCKDRDIDINVKKCLKWKKTMRVALHLSKRSESATEVFSTVLETRPDILLKLAISDIRKGTIDISLWNQVKPIISKIDLTKKSLQFIKKSLGDLNLKSNVEADYWAVVYEAFHKASEREAAPMLCKIENQLNEVDEETLKRIISEFLRDRLDKDVFGSQDSDILCMNFRLITKYLLISQNKQIQKIKRETFCDPFFDKIETLWQEPKDRSKIIDCLNDFTFALKYSKAFLSIEYEPCTRMFEWILERLHKILPRERYFAQYVCIHLTMLYSRSIRQVLEQKPEVFENLTSRRNLGVDLVGFALGKYIGIEIQELAQNYFQSVVEIYQRGLVTFFRDYFPYNECRVQLMTSMLKSLIGGGFESQLLAQYVFENLLSNYVKDQEREVILNLLKTVDNDEMKFFLYADIYPN